MTTTTPFHQLQHIIQKQPGSIKAAVAKEALDYGDIECFFRDLHHVGLKSGMIEALIYYHQVYAFFDHHYFEIKALKEELEYQIGRPIHIEGDVKNVLAWFAFEEVGKRLAREVGVI